MRNLVRVVLAAAALLGVPAVALAKVQITVDLDRQTIHVEGQDKSFDWKVSSGKSGYDTPPGSYGVLWTDKDHYSDEYDGAPMPYAIFFAPGYAIHGAYASRWGHPASHGCVRLPVAKAAILFDMVKEEGATIHIVGGHPVPLVAAARPRTQGPATEYQPPEPDGYDDAGARQDVGPAPGAATAFDPLYGKMY